MPWIVQNMHEGPVIVNDINLTFTKNQIRDVDLYGGRENAERSNDLKMLIFKKFLKDVRKDDVKANVGASASLEPSHVEQITGALNAVTQTIQDNSALHADSIKRIEEKQAQLHQQLADHKTEMQDHKAEMLDLSNRILQEVRAFAEKHPLEIRTIAEAMRNITTERTVIAKQVSELESSGSTEVDIQAQNRLLALRDKKLEKNLGNLGKTVSASSLDIADSLKAMEEIGLPVSPTNKK